jgi:hypothetical protein
MNKPLQCLVLPLLFGLPWQLPCHGQLPNQRPDIVGTYLYQGADESTFKKQLEQQIDMRIERISQVVALEPQQLRKVKLAAQGDVSRFYRELDKVKSNVQGLDPNDPNDVRSGWVAVQPLQRRLSRGIIDEVSLLERVLSTVLGPEQKQIYHDYLRERQEARYRAILRMTISDLEKTLPLTTQQRDAMITILEGKKFPRSTTSTLESYVGYAMLARLSDSEIAQFLDAPQRKVFLELTQQYAQWMNNFTW